MKKLPKWAWWVGGGSLAILVFILYRRNQAAKDQATADAAAGNNPDTQPQPAGQSEPLPFLGPAGAPGVAILQPNGIGAIQTPTGQLDHDHDDDGKHHHPGSGGGPPGGPGHWHPCKNGKCPKGFHPMKWTSGPTGTFGCVCVPGTPTKKAPEPGSSGSVPQQKTHGPPLRKIKKPIPLGRPTGRPII